MHESLDDGITPRVVTTSGDLFNTEILVHCRDESAHELGRIIAPELKRDSLDKDEPREKSSGRTRFLACGSEGARGILLESQDLSRPESRPWRDRGNRYRISVAAVGAGLRPPQRTADLTVMTR
jgi:hypothetical protein